MRVNFLICEVGICVTDLSEETNTNIFFNGPAQTYAEQNDLSVGQTEKM